jgi:hypothetical protein
MRAHNKVKDRNFFLLACLCIVLLLSCNLPGTLATHASETSAAPAVSSPTALGPAFTAPASTSEAATLAPTQAASLTAESSASHPPSPVLGWSIDAVMQSCPSQAELALLEQDFDLSFDPAAGLPPFACQDGLDPGGGVNPRLVLYQALRAISALTFSEPLPWTDLSLYEWLRNAIRGIVLTNTELSYCCDPQGRIVLKADLFSQPFLASWHDAQQGVGLEGLVGLIVHEARHAEVGGHTCGNDDLTLEELGAWGVQYWLFIWMAEKTPPTMLTAEQRDGALGHALTALGRICNP